MFDIQVDTAQAERLLKSIARLPRDLTNGLDAALKESANELAGVTRRLLRQTRGQPGEAARSRPGGPPATVTGALARSVRVKRGNNKRDVSWRVATEFYGRFLEVGADRSSLTGEAASLLNSGLKGRKTGRRRKYVARRGNGGRLEPRPFATIARSDQGPRHLARVSEALQAVLSEVQAP